MNWVQGWVTVYICPRVSWEVKAAVMIGSEWRAKNKQYWNKIHCVRDLTLNITIFYYIKSQFPTQNVFFSIMQQTLF